MKLMLFFTLFQKKNVVYIYKFKEEKQNEKQPLIFNLKHIQTVIIYMYLQIFKIFSYLEHRIIIKYLYIIFR
jgi:hypothetical protein